MQHLVLLHGAIGAKDQLQPLADILKEKYIIHTLNFSGHGGTGQGNDAYSISLFAGEVLAYMQENKISQASIFGYSMGGYVAMFIAKHYPECINRIITLATKFHWDEETAAKEVKMLDADTILQKVPAFAAQLEKRHGADNWRNVLAKTKDMLLQLGKENALQLNDYTTIGQNCLILLGEKDKMVTVEETAAVVKALPNAKYKSLPGTPHPIEQVDTALLAEEIIHFLLTARAQGR